MRRLAAIWRRPVAADSKIKRALLFDNPGLDNDARAALETFLFLVDQATHKSKLHLVQNLRDAMREGSVSIFPHVDQRHASGAHNILYLASWSLISTLPYLDFALREDDPIWAPRYRKVQLAFGVGVAAGPSHIVQAWPTILRGVFLVESQGGCFDA